MEESNSPTGGRGVTDTSVVMIGAGNLATNLAKALFRKGFRVAQVYSRTATSAKSLATAVQAEWTTELAEVTAGGSLYVVALKDDAFAELLPQIVQGREKALFVHTAGSIPMSIWEGKAERYGVFYPLQTFSKQRELAFDQIPLFLEASGEREWGLLQGIASVLSEKVLKADSEQRRNLHLAAVFACNFTNHMYALAGELLEKHKLPFDALLPLIDETARKVHELAPTQAQTGPAVRYDENVINKHLAMLADEPSMQDVYRMLSQSIHIQSYPKE